MRRRSFTDWRTRLGPDSMGVVLVDADHPLEIYVGASDFGHPLVQIRSKVKPSCRRSPSSSWSAGRRRTSTGFFHSTLQDPGSLRSSST